MNKVKHLIKESCLCVTARELRHTSLVVSCKQESQKHAAVGPTFHNSQVFRLSRLGSTTQTFVEATQNLYKHLQTVTSLKPIKQAPVFFPVSPPESKACRPLLRHFYPCSKTWHVKAQHRVQKNHQLATFDFLFCKFQHFPSASAI